MYSREDLLREFDEEMATTRRLLEIVPTERGTWKPHEKSFALGHLAQLVSMMPGWIAQAMHETKLDFANNPLPGVQLPAYRGPGAAVRRLRGRRARRPAGRAR